MSHLIWTQKAFHDLTRIHDFLAAKDTEAALRAVQTINKETLILRQFPEAGRPAYDLEPEHRELLVPFGVSGYVVLYRMQEDSVFILAVRHQKEAGL